MSPTPRCRAAALADLVRDLGDRVRPGGLPDEPPARLPTGLEGLDRLLGGGFPRGRLSEIAGRPSSGRTALALAVLATATRGGETVAVVDAADAFEPGSAATAGVELTRVLWVRPPGVREALRSAERLLEARGLALVLLDLDQPLRASSCLRLSRRAAASGTALLRLASARGAETGVALAVEMHDARPRFDVAPEWLEGIETRLVLARQRVGPRGAGAALSLRSDAA